MVSPGVYGTKASSAFLSETKEGREYVNVEFTTRNGEKISWAGYFGPNIGKDNLTLTERTSSVLRLLGWDGRWEDFSTCTKNEVDITVVEEEYNGRKTIKVGFINKLGEGGFKAKPIDPVKARSFAQRMAKETASPRGAYKGREPGSDDDEIKF